MTFLFIFAHPDDESVACAGTIRQLVKHGDIVHLIHATDGGAGEVVTPSAQAKLNSLGSVAALRQKEMRAVCEHLGIAQYEYLPFADGTITNAHVWNSLKAEIIKKIEALKPDVIITFEHTGWYFHLDHVGVSIATTLAYQQAEHRAHALLFSHFRPDGTEQKWKYVFPKQGNITHKVVVNEVEHKLATLDKHESQNLEIPKQFITQQQPHEEYYQLALAEEHGASALEAHPVFHPFRRTNLHKKTHQRGL
jgi:N-acetylglucosamine malate deacetylase 2